MIEFDSTDTFIGTTAALILGGLSAAGAIGGAAVSAHAAGSAADTEAAAANQARAYNQQATTQALGRLDAGQAGLLRAPTYNAPGVQQSGAYGALAGAMGLGARPMSPASQTPPGMVRLRAPTGEVATVPADQAAHYVSKGAVQL